MEILFVFLLVDRPAVSEQIYRFGMLFFDFALLYSLYMACVAFVFRVHGFWDCFELVVERRTTGNLV